ncbi:hypothetical protein [Lacrimispora xylanisolvens]|uniref:hypothetical protein n=1 Tax=Lacrimispora xylanisolvens TaxID=384636 RepID=UPI00240293D9
MVWEREITIEGKNFQVTISDEYEALRSAFAEGRAVIGLWDRNRTDQCLSPASYLVESYENITPELLERVVRRKEGMPWNITDTRRLLIREFITADTDEIPKRTGRRRGWSPFLQQKHIRKLYQAAVWIL